MIQPRGILVEVSIGFVFGNLLWAITGDLISHRLTYVIERHGDVSPPHIAHQSRKNPEGTRLRIGHPTSTTATSQYAATFSMNPRSKTSCDRFRAAALACTTRSKGDVKIFSRSPDRFCPFMGMSTPSCHCGRKPHVPAGLVQTDFRTLGL